MPLWIYILQKDVHLHLCPLFQQITEIIHMKGNKKGKISLVA